MSQIIQRRLTTGREKNKFELVFPSGSIETLFLSDDVAEHCALRHGYIIEDATKE